MKTSNRILLGVALGIAVMLVMLPLFILRVTVERNTLDESGKLSTDTIPTKTFSLQDFVGIHADGYWDIEIVQGKEYRVDVNVPDDIVDRLIVRIDENKMLSLARKYSPQESVEPIRLQASITLPALSRLSIKNLGRIHFTGFTTDALTIEANGHSTIIGATNNIRNLILNSQGFVKVDLKESKIANAELFCGGLVNIDLNMAGGTLSGLIDGFGKVLYSGEVSEYTLERNIWD